MAERAGANEPISLTKDPTGQQMVALWKNTRGRFDGLYRKVEACRAIVNKDVSTLSDRSDDPLVLPQRLMAITMTNSLSSQYGVPELTRHGKPVTTDKSDEIETVLKATLERSLNPADVFGKATQDGSWAMAVLPAPLDVMRMPIYSEDGYSFDAEKRKKGDHGYAGRDVGASQQAFDRDKEDFLATQQYVTIDLIDPTDCAPILVRGMRGRRFDTRGLMVRRLFSREELLGAGYVCPALSHEKASLIPRHGDGNARGRGGQLWLYTAYLMLWDEKKKKLVPVVIYSVAGEDTQRRSYDMGKQTEEQGPALINLEEEYGITTPMWGWYCGLRTADPDPDKVPLPFLDAYASLVLTLERLLAASVHHAERSSYNGYWVDIDGNEDVPPEAYTETVDNQLRMRRIDAPTTGELVVAPGKVTPAAPAPLGPAAVQMMAAMMQQLDLTAPDPAAPAGSGASGHAMSLASGLIEAAHSDIPRGVLECYQDAANWTLACIAAVMEKFTVPYVLDANEELPPDQPGDHRNVTQRYTLSERDLGGSYRVTATWRQKPDPVNVTLKLDLMLKGAASVIDVLEAAGETNTTYKVAEILYFKQVMQPGTPENLELSAYTARKRGETERAEMLELQAKQLLAPQGTPTDAIAPDAQQMAAMIAGGGGAAPGGGAPPSGVQTGVRSSIAAATQGAIGGGPATQDATVAGQMGIRPATPPTNGAGGI